ncbi:peptidase E [Candidatus Gracilibacteria bacterium]|nr:peptidase E [Candidatus Gracilibacteria bacterium]
MKKYLSSYKLGDNPEKLVELFGENKKIAFIANTCDMYSDKNEKDERESSDISDLRKIGLDIEYLDLKNYFGKKTKLRNKLQEFGGVFVCGGNVFVLRQAYKLSGLDDILINYEKNNPDFVYSGYSAGICILAPSLKGLDIVDDPNVFPYDDIQETIWEGLDILHYSISPHYDSDHPESEDIEKEIQYCIKNKILFKALRDGEVIIYD